ncbi:MAG: diguanylate cyclase domain-containing protein [Myxococcota bacterium]
MQLQRQAFFAASMRLLFGVLALASFPAVFPDLLAFRWLLVAYTSFSAAAMVLVYFEVGGRFRPYALGVIDVALLTVLLFLVGPSSVLVSAYFLLAILNALVVSAGYGVFLALAGSVSYALVLVVELARLPLLGNAPARWLEEPVLSIGHASFAWAFVTVMLSGSTAVVANLVRRLEEDEARLQELIIQDPLTGLFNRRHIMDTLDRELARVRRGHPLSVLMMDLDGFKRINDTHGHEQGDRLLEQLAAALESVTRATDIPGRWGGDEFVVLLPDTRADEAERVASRLAERIREIGEQFDPERVVTASIGIAGAGPEDTPNGLLHRADRRAYQAKQAGGDRVANRVA